ncbi:MAG: hypothetical protein HYV02_02320 [Deltaproteobacteria bacterium]|nr:hypothetical protein [Deltaproteobacteria bacterium]
MRRLFKISCSLIIGLVAWSSVGLHAMAIGVPHFLQYQGHLTESGGAPIPSGTATLHFRITDHTESVLYEEEQEVNILQGEASALIGNGVDPTTGAVQNGLPSEVLTPETPRFLEVWVNGELADAPAEIVAVPYAYWSQNALAVAEESVTAAAIAPQSIQWEHLGETLLDEVATALVIHPIFQSSLASAQGAAGIGVNTTLNYSGAKTVQGVLEDLDAAIRARDEKKVDKAGDTMTGKLTILSGGLEVVGEITSGNLSAMATAVEAHATSTNAHGALGSLIGETTLNAGLGTKLGLSGGTLSGDLDLGGHRLTNVGPAVAETDAVSKATVATVVNAGLGTKLDLSGGTLSGELDLGGHRLTNVGPAVAETDGVSKATVAAMLSDPAVNPGANPDLISPPPAPTIVAWGEIDCSATICGGVPAAQICTITSGTGIAEVGCISGAGKAFRVRLTAAIPNSQYIVQGNLIATPPALGCTTGFVYTPISDDTFDVYTADCQRHFALSIIANQ